MNKEKLTQLFYEMIDEYKEDFDYYGEYVEDVQRKYEEADIKVLGWRKRFHEIMKDK